LTGLADSANFLSDGVVELGLLSSMKRFPRQNSIDARFCEGKFSGKALETPLKAELARLMIAKKGLAF